jgi:glycerol-3-phosphate acyltransferase PlsY
MKKQSTILYVLWLALTLLLITSCMAAALAIFQHRGNIKRLMAGEENRLDFQKISKVSEKVMQRMQKKNK